MPGYPDWQKAPQVRSALLFNNASVTLTTALATVTTQNTSNYSYLNVVSSPTGNNAELDFQFQDSTGAVTYATYVIQIRAGDSGVYQVPIAGDQVVVRAKRQTGAAATLSLQLAATNVPYTVAPGTGGTIIANTSITGVAQNGTAAVVFSGYQGLAWVYADTTQLNFNLRVRQFQLDGATVASRTLGVHFTQGLGSAQVYIPPVIGDVIVTNLDAGTATIQISLVAQAWAGH